MNPKQDVAIHASALWDGTGAALLRDATVVVREGSIKYAGPHREADGGDVVDLPGATLLPGLIDAHVHLSDDGWMLPLLLSAGVTTVRDTGNNHRALISLRERQARGEWLGPRIRTFGPLIDGPSPHWPHIARAVDEGDTVEAIVDELVSDGVDGLKTYVRLPADDIRRVVARARDHNVPVTCHCSECKAREVLSYGMGCVEHVTSLDALEDGARWDTFGSASDPTQNVVDAFLERDAWFCPTLGVMRAVEHGWGLHFRTYPGYERYAERFQDYMANLLGSGSWDQERIDQAYRDVEGMHRATLALHEAGVHMLAGSDAPWVPPGDGMHHELQLLVDAGIAAADALAMATREPARYLGLDDEVGTVEPGKVADLLAVRGDPLRDIGCIRDVAGVWQAGARLDVETLVSGAADAASKMRPREDGTPMWGIPYERSPKEGNGT